MALSLAARWFHGTDHDRSKADDVCLRQMVELLLDEGALPLMAGPADLAVLRPITNELVRKARMPDLVNETVVGLAHCISWKRPRGDV